MTEEEKARQAPPLPKIQHYVPRLLLRGFCSGKRDHVYVFDKREERTYPANIEKVARERSYYDLETDEFILSLEPRLAALESRTASVIRRIIDTHSLALTDHDRAVVAVFAAVQLLRGPGPREQSLDAGRQMEAKLREIGSDEAAASAMATDEDGAKFVAMSLTNRPGDFAVYFLDKTWGLLRAPREEPFYICDSPVVMHNGRPRHPMMGNLGLAVPGIEIYLPLTKSLTLAFLCRSIYAELKEGLHGAAARGVAPAAIASTAAFVDGLEGGTPIDLKRAEAIHCNSLQVGHAARYVYASTEGFAVAKEMIRRNPGVRSGPRMRLL